MATAQVGDQTANHFAVSREQRLRLLAEDYRPLMFDYQPDKPNKGLPNGCEVGAIYVLSWSKSQAGRQPTRTITVSKIGRHKSGSWLVRFDLVDLRESVRYLRRTPPIMDPHVADDGKAESSYTTSRWAAMDELEVVPTNWQERCSRLAYENDHALRLE